MLYNHFSKIAHFWNDAYDKAMKKKYWDIDLDPLLLWTLLLSKTENCVHYASITKKRLNLWKLKTMSEDFFLRQQSEHIDQGRLNIFGSVLADYKCQVWIISNWDHLKIRKKSVQWGGVKTPSLNQRRRL